MTDFNVRFTIDNAAFKGPDGAGANEAEDSVATNAEIARLLRRLAVDVEEMGSERIIRLRDANGHRVGFATSLEVIDALDELIER